MHPEGRNQYATLLRLLAGWFPKLPCVYTKWKQFTVADGLPFRAIAGIDVYKKTGDVWLGLFGGGLARFSSGRFDHWHQLNSGLVNDVFYGVAVENDNVWAATTAGASRFNVKTHEWSIFTEKNAPMEEIWNYSVNYNGKDKVHLAVWGSGVLEYDIPANRWKDYLDPDGEMEIDLYRDDGAFGLSLALDHITGGAEQYVRNVSEHRRGAPPRLVVGDGRGSRAQTDRPALTPEATLDGFALWGDTGVGRRGRRSSAPPGNGGPGNACTSFGSRRLFVHREEPTLLFPVPIQAHGGAVLFVPKLNPVGGPGLYWQFVKRLLQVRQQVLMFGGNVRQSISVFEPSFGGPRFPPNQVDIADVRMVERPHGVTGDIPFSGALDDIGEVFLARFEAGRWEYCSREDLHVPQPNIPRRTPEGVGLTKPGAP